MKSRLPRSRMSRLNLDFPSRCPRRVTWVKLEASRRDGRFQHLASYELGARGRADFDTCFAAPSAIDCLHGLRSRPPFVSINSGEDFRATAASGPTSALGTEAGSVLR